MAKAKPAAENSEAPVSTEEATDPVTNISSAIDVADANKVLPVSEAGATTEGASDGTSTVHAGGTSDFVDLTIAANGGEIGQALPELGSTDVSSINDAAFDQVMKRFVSQGKTVMVKGPEKGRWRAGRHFTMEPTSIPLVDLTEAELEKLCGDPLLTVMVVDAPY